MLADLRRDAAGTATRWAPDGSAIGVRLENAHPDHHPRVWACPRGAGSPHPIGG